MDEDVRDPLTAARKLAALSPQTSDRLRNLDLRGLPEDLAASLAFKAIGMAIASKRNPISSKELKAIFAMSERFLWTEDISNYIATDMLEAIYAAANGSGFDFLTVDPFLGPQARKYLVAWDDARGTHTRGLTRQ